MRAARFGFIRTGTVSHNYVSLEGKSLAGTIVVARAPNLNGKSRWDCRLACGHTRTVAGIHLRALENEGKQLRCVECEAHYAKQRAVRLVINAGYPARIEALPTSQQGIAVAFGACWHVAARRPTREELAAQGLKDDNKTMLALRDKGLVELNHRSGKYQPTQSLIEQTETLLQQINFSTETAAE